MLSVIIPMGGEDSKGRRLRNLFETLGCIERQTFTDYEVVLVEEVFNNDIIFEDSEVDRYIKVDGDKHGNRSWTRNIGALASKGDRLLQLDGDVLFDVDYFQRIVDNRRPWFMAWNACIRLTEEGSGVYSLTQEFTELPRYMDNHYGVIHPCERGAAGFSACFSRDFYFKRLGGYNENFTGWGGEDNDIALRSRHLVGKLQTMPYTIYHQPHGNREGGNNEFEVTKQDPHGVTERLLERMRNNQQGRTRSQLLFTIRR